MNRMSHQQASTFCTACPQWERAYFAVSVCWHHTIQGCKAFSSYWFQFIKMHSTFIETRCTLYSQSTNQMCHWSHLQSSTSFQPSISPHFVPQERGTNLLTNDLQTLALALFRTIVSCSSFIIGTFFPLLVFHLCHCLCGPMCHEHLSNGNCQWHC